MRPSDSTKESGITLSVLAGEDWWLHQATGELLARLGSVEAERDALREALRKIAFEAGTRYQVREIAQAAYEANPE